MRIKSLEVQQFRALKQFGPVGVERMCVVIGENDTGKTSLMLALDVFFHAKKLENQDDYFRKDIHHPVELELCFTQVGRDCPADIHTNREGCLRVRCSYAYGENRKLEVFPKVPRDPELAGFGDAPVAGKRDILRKIGMLSPRDTLAKVECDRLFQEYLAANAGNVQWRDDQPRQISEMEFAKIVPDFVLVPATRNLESNLGLGERSLTGRLFRQVLRSVLAGNETQACLRQLKQQAAAGVQERVEELGAILRELTNDSTLALEHSFDMDPLKGLILEMYISDAMVEGIPVLNRGAGLQNSLLLAIFRLLAQHETSEFILAIEEPENSLHPRAQREMLWALQALSKSSQVIVTTHSPVFIDLGLFENNLFMTRTSGGATFTRTFADKDTLKLREILGVRPSDALLCGGGNFAVIVEGDTEQHLFPHLFDRAGIPWRSLGISIVPAFGADEEKIMSRVRILASYRIPAIAILDGDKARLAEDLRRYCRNDPFGTFLQVFMWRKREIEDYFPVKACVEVLNEMFPDGAPILPEDVSSEESRMHELGRLVHEKKGPGARWNIAKVQFGELVGRKIAKERLPLDDEILQVLRFVEAQVLVPDQAVENEG